MRSSAGQTYLYLQPTAVCAPATRVCGAQTHALVHHCAGRQSTCKNIRLEEAAGASIPHRGRVPGTTHWSLAALAWGLGVVTR